MENENGSPPPASGRNRQRFSGSGFFAVGSIHSSCWREESRDEERSSAQKPLARETDRQSSIQRKKIAGGLETEFDEGHFENLFKKNFFFFHLLGWLTSPPKRMSTVALTQVVRAKNPLTKSTVPSLFEAYFQVLEVKNLSQPNIGDHKIV